ncbi:MAG: hypothetical protein K5924_12610 [Chloroflexi bacterium]|nr:hypothetical protein [Chloroflexota bacterium]
MSLQETRFQVLTHEWSEPAQRPWRQSLLGMTDNMQEADAMVAAHAAEHGLPVDHRYYSISVAPYPDPESLARDVVAGYVRHEYTLEGVIRGQGGMRATGYESQIGGYRFEPGAQSGTKLKPYEMYCRVGFEWRVFDLRVLWAEAKSGMRQGALL